MFIQTIRKSVRTNSKRDFHTRIFMWRTISPEEHIIFCEQRNMKWFSAGGGEESCIRMAKNRNKNESKARALTHKRIARRANVLAHHRFVAIAIVIIVKLLELPLPSDDDKYNAKGWQRWFSIDFKLILDCRCRDGIIHGLIFFCVQIYFAWNLIWWKYRAWLRFFSWLCGAVSIKIRVLEIATSTTDEQIAQQISQWEMRWDREINMRRKQSGDGFFSLLFLSFSGLWGARRDFHVAYANWSI